MDTVEIGNIGEKHVVAWLKTKNFSNISHDTRLPGSTDIEADGKESLLIQVKTAIYPSSPGYLSSDEIRNIKSRASNTNRIAYIAKVQIDSKGNLYKEIEWSKP